MITSTDQFGRQHTFDSIPERVISLVPSITELLYDLGLGSKVIARTSYCIHPSREVTTIPTIGGTKKVNLSKIKLLHPDLIIANKEENRKEDIYALDDLCPVWCSNISNMSESYEMILEIAKLMDQQDKALEIISQSKETIQHNQVQSHPSVLYLIWKDPYMAAGGDTYISDVLSHLGYTNILQYQARYPELSIRDIVRLDPDIILLSSEPYDFQQLDVAHLMSTLPCSDIQLVSGEFYSWYGSRLTHLTTPRLP